MKKKILSGILALTMCFSMMPSIAWGGEISEFSAGEDVVESACNEAEFIDEVEQEEALKIGKATEASTNEEVQPEWQHGWLQSFESYKNTSFIWLYCTACGKSLKIQGEQLMKLAADEYEAVKGGGSASRWIYTIKLKNSETIINDTHKFVEGTVNLTLGIKVSEDSCNIEQYDVSGYNCTCDFEKPKIGLESNKTYCEGVSFTVTDNKEVSSVGYYTTASEVVTALSIGTDDKYQLPADFGEATIVATDTSGNKTEITIKIEEHAPYEDDGDCSTPVKCKNCSEITTPAKNHDFLGEWKSDANGHWHECRNSGCKITEQKKDHKDENEKDHKCDICKKTLSECSGGTATCKDKAVCDYCGESYGELDSSNHTGGTEIRNMKDATCTEDGYTGDTYCKSCDEKISDGNVIGKTGNHEWSENGLELISPTEWLEGIKERTCTICNQKSYIAIPKTGETRDLYAGIIDKNIRISTGVNLKWAVINNKESQFLEGESFFENTEKTDIKNKYVNGESGQIAKVWLEITKISSIDAENQIREKVKEIVGENAELLLFNADLFSQYNGNNKKTITDPDMQISIRFKVPDNMVTRQPYTIRNYKILRLHNNVVEELKTSFNSSTNEVTFETDKFSIFALAYKDTYYSPSYPVTGIKVSPESITLTKKDETAQLTAEVTPSYADNKKVTWKSSDEKVATVDENGKVTAVGNGTATITATSVSGSYTATASVTVKIPVEIEKLTIEAEKEILTQIGETTELKVKIEPENADEQKLIWKSDNEMVAAVDENGKVTAVGNGTATITVTTEDGKVTASVMITVKIPEKPVINKTTGFGRLRARSAKQTKTSVTLQWNRLNDVDGYLIYGNRCNGNGKTYKL